MFFIRVYLVEKTGRGCPSCSGTVTTDKNRLSVLFPDVAKEWNYSKNGDKTPSSVSYASNKKFWWKCSLCGNEWISVIANRTSGKNGCPICRESKGEKRLLGALNKKGIKIIPQHQFKDCKNIRRLLFDFYLPDYKTCIEYDGILHYADKFGNSKEFIKTKERDAIKTKYCKERNIKLIRIPYWELENIENILSMELGNR